MSTDILGMAKSYEFIMSELRGDYPHIPKKLMGWSAGHFYNYLLPIAYSSGNNEASFRFLKIMARPDLAIFLSPPIYRMEIITCLRKIVGPNFLKRRRSKDIDPEAARMIWIPAHWIEARRWAKLQKGLI